MIAIEEHWHLPEISTALKALPAERGDASIGFNEIGDHLGRLADLGDARVAWMDDQGVDLQILSLTPPATQPLDPAEARVLSRRANDIAADAVRRRPARLRAFATLPMADPQAAAAELERAAALGFVGAMVYGRSGERLLDDRCYDELWATAEALRQPIFIHPQIPSATVRRAAYGGYDQMTDLALATFAWGWHVEAALAALRLIIRGTFDRYPGLQLVLGHWGELLPFWTGRADSLSSIAGLQRKVSEYLRSNIHLTCSGMLDPALLRHALEVTTPDRLLFSTDYPFQRPSRPEIEKFMTEFPTDTSRELFAVGNARALFGIS